MSKTVDQLVKLNNEKRKLLKEENERYYTDVLLYVRMQWRLSEKQSEELLLEILDHLLDAQVENKTAQEVFGDNPNQFAHDLIEEIAKEKPQNMAKFIGGIVIMLTGWALVIRAIILYGISFVTDVNTDLNLFRALMSFLAITAYVTGNLWYIFKEIKTELFKKNKRKNILPMIKIGLLAGITMVLLLLIIVFCPEIGVSVPFGPVISFPLGLILLGIYYAGKSRKKTY